MGYARLRHEVHVRWARDVKIEQRNDGVTREDIGAIAVVLSEEDGSPDPINGA